MQKIDFNKNISWIKKDFELSIKKLKKLKILKSCINKYNKWDKESFLKLWLEFITIFNRLKFILKKTKYRKFIFWFNYNYLAINRYVTFMYYDFLVQINLLFWKHEKYLRKVLEEKYNKDYWKIAKYIYKPKYINLINTPNILILPFKPLITKKYYSFIDIDNIQIGTKNRIFVDYSNLYFYIRNRIEKVFFYFSKKIWLLLSNIKFTRRKKWLITKWNYQKYLNNAKKWDILLTRWNWNATNIPIPWFWKHMSIYVWKWDFLQDNFKFLKNKKISRNKHFIIEATSEWILLKPFSKLTEHNDYLWVFRTQFSNNKIKKVIKNALLELWKWYDYWLNYYSDKNMVCSELVLKSYQKDSKKDEWIEIDLESIWLSLSFPPNNIFNILKNNNIKPVFFIDSIEKTWKNFINTNNELIKSKNRSRFTFLNK